MSTEIMVNFKRHTQTMWKREIWKFLSIWNQCKRVFLVVSNSSTNIYLWQCLLRFVVRTLNLYRRSTRNKSNNFFLKLVNDCKFLVFKMYFEIYKWCWILKFWRPCNLYRRTNPVLQKVPTHRPQEIKRYQFSLVEMCTRNGWTEDLRTLRL